MHETGRNVTRGEEVERSKDDRDLGRCIEIMPNFTYLIDEVQPSEESLPRTHTCVFIFTHIIFTLYILAWRNALSGVLEYTVESLDDFSDTDLHPVLRSCKYRARFKDPIVDAPKYLNLLLDQLKSKPMVKIMLNQHKFASFKEMIEASKRLNCNVVVNCTGLGAREIMNDKDLVPAKGVILHYPRPVSSNNSCNCFYCRFS